MKTLDEPKEKTVKKPKKVNMENLKEKLVNKPKETVMNKSVESPFKKQSNFNEDAPIVSIVGILINKTNEKFEQASD